MKTIVITGTPGTGKTTVATKLSQILNFYYMDVNKVIKKYDLSEGYDKKRKSKIVDTKLLNKALKKEISEIKEGPKSKKGLIIDSHLAHYLPEKYVDLCIITKCGLKILEKRLKKRNYSQSKIRENLDAEIFDICLIEAREKKHDIMLIDTSKTANIDKIQNNKKILDEIKLKLR
ncbi:AAA family ATPase [Candidatus Woesearchaeota archaeon]|nr:AAA family ATPase [Candidatus Woesearchaeota archaeon]